MIPNQNNYIEDKWQAFYNHAQLHPGLYAILTAGVAVLGYALLLLFPALFVYGAWKILSVHIESYSNATLVYLAFWLCLTIIAGIISMALSRLSFKQVEGISLQSPTQDHIKQLLSRISDQTKIPHVDNIVISEQISIDLVKIPRFPFPVWCKNTLVIGLPLMQCLSPEYFECAVVRKLLQHAKYKGAILKWLHQLRTIWQLYALHFSTKRSISYRIMGSMFRLYAPFYRALAVPIANRVELMADADTLSIINDEDLLQTIEKVIVTKIFMDKEYWPKIAKMQKQGLTLSIKPYTRLDETLKADLTTKSAKRWLDSLYEHESHRMHALPSLRTRMNNIGRTRIRIPERTLQTAAHYYLDKNYSSVIASVNQLWLQRNSRLATAKQINPQSAKNSPVAQSSLPSSYRFDLQQ